MITEVIFRTGTITDSFTVFVFFKPYLVDLFLRIVSTPPTSAVKPQALEHMWIRHRSLCEHLACILPVDEGIQDFSIIASADSRAQALNLTSGFTLNS